MCAYGCVLSKCESKAGDAVEEEGEVEGVGTEVQVIGAEGKAAVSVSPWEEGGVRVEAGSSGMFSMFSTSTSSSSVSGGLFSSL